MRRIILLLTLISLVLWSPQSTHASTPMPLQFQQLLYIPPISTEYGDDMALWAAWNPAGENFAAVYDYEVHGPPSSIHIMNGATGSITQYLGTMDSGTGNSTFAWSPDGTRIAAILGNSGNVLKIWDLTGKPIEINRIGETDPYRQPYWSPDGLKLAETEYVPASSVSSDDGGPVLFIWDAQTGKLLSKHVHTDIGAWSPDGKKMVVWVSNDDSLEIVDPATFQVLFTFPPIPQYADFGDVAIWTPDSRQVMVDSCDYGSDCTIWTWDATTGQAEKHLVQDIHIGPEYEFALNSSGTLLASTLPNGFTTVDFWDVQSGAQLNSLDAGEGITSLSWRNDQDILLLGGIDGSIQVWKVTRVSTLQM